MTFAPTLATDARRSPPVRYAASVMLRVMAEESSMCVTAFEDRGRRELKGVSEPWQLYAASRDSS